MRLDPIDVVFFNDYQTYDRAVETLTGRDLPPRDGFKLRVELKQDYEWNIYDCGMDRSKPDLAAWNRMDWLFVGVVVTASRDGEPLGDASIWKLPHGVMGDGVRVDVLGPCGEFAAHRELLITEAVADAINNLHRMAASDDSDGTEWEWPAPTLERLDHPAHPSLPWLITWPDGATSTYRRRRDAECTLLRMVQALW
jgi:hypothetical protein